MGKQFPCLFFATCLGVALFSLQASADQDSSWQAKMQKLYASLSATLTDVCSDARFYDPANKHRIEKEAEALAKQAHTLSAKNSDPMGTIVASLLKRQADGAVYELQHGDRIYARAILRTIPTYCIACHTRNQTGPQFAKLNFEPAFTLNNFDRGEFFAASRQFDRALPEFQKIIEGPEKAGVSRVLWKKAIQESLAIAVRVRKDPVVAKKIIQSIAQTERAPAFMREDAVAWNKSVEDWQVEKENKNPSEDDLYLKAKELLAKATEMQKYPMDRNADIYYWRASAVLQDLLELAPNGTHSIEALLMAGIAYEVLNPLELDGLHEVFYESCIRKSPHSQLANTCFNRLEASILSHYAGVSGTDISKNTLATLDELKNLAQTK